MSDRIIFVSMLVALVVFWILGAHNRLMRLRNALASAFTPLDAQLVQRLETVQRLSERAAAAEPPLDRGLLDAAGLQAREALEQARRQPVSADLMHGLAQREQALDESLARWTASLSDPCPADVKAALDEWASLSSPLAFARQQFNAAVQAYNQAVRQAPTHMVANLFGFRLAAELPEVPPALAELAAPAAAVGP